MKTTYTTTAKVFHWSMALLIFAAMGIGEVMGDMKMSPEKLQMFSWHKWIGVTVFFLCLLRIVWRISHKPPELPSSMPSYQRWASEAVHLALYALMLTLPLSGWLMSSAKGFQTVWFGVVPLPDLLSKDIPLGKMLEEVHEMLNAGFMLLLAGHIGAALKHRFIDRDGIMERMLPSFKKEQS